MKNLSSKNWSGNYSFKKVVIIIMSSSHKRGSKSQKSEWSLSL